MRRLAKLAVVLAALVLAGCAADLSTGLFDLDLDAGPQAVPCRGPECPPK